MTNLTPIFDTHAHLVTPDQQAYPPKPLRGVLAPGEFDNPNSDSVFRALMQETGVKSACAVQRAHIYGYDNSYILACSRAYPEELRAVAVLNAADPTTPATLKELVVEKGAAGVRYVSPSFPSGALDWLTSDEAHASFKAAADLNIPICVHVLHVQRDAVLPEVVKLVKAFPDAQFVLDHVGGAHPAHIEQMWMKEQGIEFGTPLTSTTLELVDCPNATVKLSTINLECTDDPADFVKQVVAEFGAERIVWGSDIGQTRGDYRKMVQLVRDAVAPLSAEDQAAILYSNAEKIYGLRAA